MARHKGGRKVRDYRLMPRQIALTYLVLGSAWIALSDWLARALAPDLRTLTVIQTYKGWLFVAVTAALLYFLIRLYTAKSYELMGRLIDAETRFRQFFNTVPDVLFTARLPGFEVSFATPSLQQLLGYSPDELSKQPKLWLERLLQPQEVIEHIERQLEEDGHFSVDCQIRHRDRSLRWIRTHGRISSEAGVHDTVFGVMTDITGIKRAEQQAVRDCLRDGSTDLLTAPAFSLALDTLINGAYQHELLLSCACLGIDDFAQLRARHGDRHADRLLARLSEQLLQALRDNRVIGPGRNVLVARHRDRFLFVMPERNVAATMAQAKRLLHDLDLAVGAEQRAVAIRIGIASHPLPGEDADAFIADAMAALEAARGDTHTRITLYNVLERERLTEETAARRRSQQG